MQPYELIPHLRDLRQQSLAQDTIERAQHCLLDWLGVTIAGSREPAARRIVDFVRRQYPGSNARLIGEPSVQSSMLGAAFANGVSGHVLDFDDVHLRLWGHPSAVILPAGLALAEALGRSGADLITAMVVGTEAVCRLGDWLGESHYGAGWHSTATLGTFGAAATACSLLELREDQWRHAFNLAACRAAGLQASFGSDAKPFQVGKASAAGLEAAMLAAEGIEGPSDAFTGDRGFFSLYAGTRNDMERGEDQRPCIQSTSFKYHASCFGTHAAAEAVYQLRERQSAPMESPAHVTIDIPPRFLQVCNIAEPSTPAQAKFSVRHVCALALAGRSTCAAAGFSSAALQDARLRALRERIEVRPDAQLAQAAARARAHFKTPEGLRIEETYVDLSSPEPDTRRQGARLREKFLTIVAPVIGAQRARELMARCETAFQVTSVSPLLDLAA